MSIIGLLSYVWLQYFETNQNSDEVQYFVDDLLEDSNFDTEIPISKLGIFLKTLSHIMSLFLTLCITIALFPSITSSVLSPKNPNDLFITMHFLVYNLADWIGKSIPGIISSVSRISSVTLHFLSLSRLIFVPLFFHCNINLFNNDNQKLYTPTIWFGDFGFFLLIILFALSNGLISTLLLMQAPKLLKETEWEGSVEAHWFVGDCMVFGLGCGLTVGALCSFALRSYLCQCNPFTSV